MPFRILVGLMLVLFSLNTGAQELNVAMNTRAEKKHFWKASWITHPQASKTDYGVFHLRNEIRLNEVPDSFIIHVSADPRYRLYVNGQSVAFGPARGTLLYWRYETLDIAPYLVAGKNVLAAEVFNFGEHRLHFQQSIQTAFIFQTEADEYEKLNTGAGNWKIAKNEAYAPLTYRHKPGGLYAVGPGDQVDGTLYPWGWEQPGFDDSKWLMPQKMELGHGPGAMYGNGWHLVKRSIPLLEQTHEAIPGVSTDLEIPANSEGYLLLDQAYLTVGYPELWVSKGKGSSIQLTYTEALYATDTLEGGQVLYEKGNRDHTEGKVLLGTGDLFFPDGGDQRMFRPLWIRVYRYISMKITTGDEPLIIHDYYNMYTAYPYEREARFETGVRVLDDIMEVGWRTQRLCAGETYFDCPYYEQLNYAGDTRIQALTTHAMTADDRLVKDAIKLLDESRLPIGLTQSRAPGWRVQVIPGYSLYYISMIYDYLRFRDDDQWARQFLKGIRYNLEWFEENLDEETGLLKALEWWNYTDWTREWMGGIPDQADNGYSSIINIHFLYTLRQAIEIFEYFGEEPEAKRLKQLTGELEPAIIEMFYNKSRGLFADTPAQDVYSQHANILAILSGLCPEGQMEALMEKILQDDDLIQCTFYYSYYLFEALKKSGMGYSFIDQLGPWEQMMDMGLTTFAERPEPTRSDCHAWSASPLYFYMTLVCGIEPAGFGFKKVRIEPELGALEYVQGSMPHPEGMIEINLHRKGKQGIEGSISLPEGISGTFVWNGSETILSPGLQKIRVNDFEPSSGIGVYDADGWTILKPSPDSRIVYVSDSEGDDANDGWSPSAPKKTIEAGAVLLRDGYPRSSAPQKGRCWIMGEGLGAFYSGRSAAEPMVVASYGEQGARPLINTEGPFVWIQEQKRSNLAFVGLELYAYKHDPNSPDYESEGGVSGISMIGASGENILIEDCKFNYMQMGAYTTGRGNAGNLKNLNFRRNICIHSWAGDSYTIHELRTRVQGMFVYGADGFLLEENLFDHNGWDEQIEGAGATMYNHNIYMSTSNPNCDKIIVRGNIIARASAHGLQLRSGGLVEDNLFVQNAINLNVGYHKSASMPGAHGMVRNNVFQEVRLMDSTNVEYPRTASVRGIGEITIPSVIENNIFSHCINEAQIGVGAYDDKWGFGGELVQKNNLVYKWTVKSEEPDPAWPDPERKIGEYHAGLGKEGTTEGFLLEARKRPLKIWWPDYSAKKVNAYIREGFYQDINP